MIYSRRVSAKADQDEQFMFNRRSLFGDVDELNYKTQESLEYDVTKFEYRICLKK